MTIVAEVRRPEITALEEVRTVMGIKVAMAASFGGVLSGVG